MTVRGRLLWSVLGLLALAGLGASLATGLVSGATTRDGAAAASGPATTTPDTPAQPLAGPTLGGGEFDLADWRGKVVVVNVWASWCAPCRDELPVLAGAATRWSGDGLRVLGVNVRDRDDAARDLLAELGAADLTTVRDPDGELAVSWGVQGVPETFVVDREGVVRLWARGPVTTEWLERHLVPLLES